MSRELRRSRREPLEDAASSTILPGFRAHPRHQHGVELFKELSRNRPLHSKQALTCVCKRWGAYASLNGAYQPRGSRLQRTRAFFSGPLAYQ
jgi:hypothetical protein